MKRNYIVTILFLCVCSTVFAQGDFRFSEQMFSRINQNPSAIGNNEKMQVFTATRLQWIDRGVNQAPVSALLNAHYYADKIKSGFGLSFVYDELGMANQTIDAKICYAYNLDLREDLLLSLGLSAGVVNKSFDPNKHIWKDDAGRPTEVVSSTAFDMDFGFELSWTYLLAGFSITHLPNIASEVSSVTAPSHINAYVRGNIPLPRKFSLIPAIAYANIGALNKGAVAQDETGASLPLYLTEQNLIDYSVTAMYDGRYWLGVGYRSGVAGAYSSDMVAFMLGFEWHWLRLGYSFDLSVGKLANYSSQTHEIMLSFIIPTKKPVVW